MPAWCFYPMSKKREAHANWFTLPFDDRKALDARARRQRSQVRRPASCSTSPAPPGSTTSSGASRCSRVHPDDLKEVVYTMRFDEASALYGEFGVFYTGFVVPVEELVTSI